MPVARGPAISARSALVVGASGVAAAVMLLLFVLWVTGSSDKVDVRLGDDQFEGLDADRISAEIADRGPAFFADLVGDERPIWLNHTGDDPDSGWIAFEARVPNRPDCLVEYRPDDDLFVDLCDPAHTFPPTGEGLTMLPVVVDDGEVTVNLNPTTDDSTTTETP